MNASRVKWHHGFGMPPIAAFAAAMGYAGLGLAWRLATVNFGAPAWIGEALIAIALVIEIVMIARYATKTIRMPDAVAAEMTNPASANYFSSVSISLGLLAAGILPYSQSIATVLWATAVIIGLIVMLGAFGSFALGPVGREQLTPAWFLPPAGLVTNIAAGAALGHADISWNLFGIAVVGWLALLPLVLGRLFFDEPLPVRFAPTLGVLISSPAVIGSAYAVLAGVGPPLHMLVAIALFFTLLVIRLYPLARGQVFTVGAWGYTFPLAALAGLLGRYQTLIHTRFTAFLALSGLAAATVVVAIVSTLAVRHYLRRCSAEAGAASVPEISTGKILAVD